MNHPIVEARGLTKIYPMPSGPVVALQDVDLTLAAGDFVAITGASGCGKSTLLHMLGCVDTPTSGEVRIDGVDVAGLNDAARSRLRLTSIGFVFQRFFLLPMLTAGENVDLPQLEAGRSRKVARNRTLELLDYVGLADRVGHRPSQLSGGQMQRVAIARALANRPGIVLADEPTGELDEGTGEQIAGLLNRVHRDGTTVFIATHDPKLAGLAHRRLVLGGRDHRLQETGEQKR